MVIPVPGRLLASAEAVLRPVFGFRPSSVSLAPSPSSSGHPPGINKAEIDVFLELSCFFDDPEDVGNLISSSSAFSKTSLNIRKFMVHILLT